MKKILLVALCGFSFSVFADSLYQKDRQFCYSTNSYQSQVDCLREAGAAQQERERHTQTSDMYYSTEDYEDNKFKRCQELDEEDYFLCKARLMDEYGTYSGSVESGGIIRQVEVFIIENPEPLDEE